MPRQRQTTKQVRRRHTQEFKAEALALAAQVGVSEAASQLKLQSSQLYGWKAKAQQTSRQVQADQQLATENARLKRELAESRQEVAILKKASAYFARNLT